ncbi:FMN-binding negative transcriptional regulator [Nonomuraea sp. NPDC049480]|uniref:FMN-binding negative transcriptional regulator n=1 Tax=Nonomuraea sp. NPDC049480 TaxID=3364353 RepID=UPI0037894ED5
MHVFPRYAAKDPKQVAELIRQNPFALVVSAVDGVPVATHVPVIQDGGTLLGHMARANPQWRSWESGPDVLVVSLRAPSWEPTPASRDRFAALLPRVMAFRVHVRTEQSMFKLSQDIDVERHARVRDAFAAENPRLADLMDGS